MTQPPNDLLEGMLGDDLHVFERLYSRPIVSSASATMSGEVA